MTNEEEEMPDWREAYAEDGTDLSQIWSFLALTPAERLDVLQGHANAVLKIRKLNAGR